MNFSLLGGVYDSQTEEEDDVRHSRRSAEDAQSSSSDDDTSSEDEGDEDAAREGGGSRGHVADQSRRPQLLGEGDPWGSSHVAASQDCKQSTLPSPFDMFAEVKGPPSFLDPPAIRPVPGLLSGREESLPNYHASAAPANGEQQQAPMDKSGPSVMTSDRTGLQTVEKNVQQLPVGAVITAKPHIISSSIRDRPMVDDGEAGGASHSGTGVRHVEGGEAVVRKYAEGTTNNRVYGVLMPPKDDASQLLRFCDRCGIPKTFSNSFGGLICPQCKGQTPLAAGAAEKGMGEGGGGKEEGKGKRKVTVRDKEKSKRMRGQSSHATWKSETEMHLRQQFD